uniref:Ran-binding protein 3-like n=1 Tax=Nothobranchius furzeri TaxID=105023 RepID=A0A8C6Q4T5_NOTFU
MTSLNIFLTDKPAIAPPVFVFQKDKAQKRSAEGSSAEDGEDSDKDEGSYCPPVKRERTSSFPPPHSAPKNNVFMPSTFCQSPTGNSDSEPEEKPVGFRLKPPTLIHGKAPSSGVPSQKPKEQQRSVLRPAVLQAPPSKSHKESSKSSYLCFLFQKHENKEDEETDKDGERRETDADIAISFVFGQNIKDRAKVGCFCSFLDFWSHCFNYRWFQSHILLLVDVHTEVTALSVLESQQPVKLCFVSTANSVSESLAESAAAYTKATAKKCILEKVDVKTGEESESNVLQMQCKLYVFEKTAQSWIERGRGLLRLNDMASTDDGTLQSRLVMRTQGSLRLILNTKLWPQMQVDKASEKSVRITAMDTEDQGVKVFLISGSSKDIGQLAAALHHRILALKSRADQEPEIPPTTIPSAEVPQSNEDDSDEEDKGSASAAASTPATSNSEGTENHAAGST